MKTKNILIAIAALTIFQISCSNPGSEGKKAGESFCDCMNGKTDAGKSVTSIFSAKDSCETAAMTLLKQAEDKYKTDAQKLSEVDNAYKNTTQKTYSDFTVASTKAIADALSKSVWVREGKTNNDNYLISFASNNISPLNEKGEVEFRLSGDTLFLNDEKKTALLMFFTKDGKLSISNLDKSSSVNFHQPDNHEKLIGYWQLEGGKRFIYNFNPDQTYHWSDGSFEINGKYVWNNNEITLSEYFFGNNTYTDKLDIDDVNQISMPHLATNALGAVPMKDYGKGNAYKIYNGSTMLTRIKTNKLFDLKTLYRL